MTTIRKFCCNDLLRITSVNLDHLSYSASMYLYMKWLVKWPNYSHVAIAPGNQIMGYIIGGFKEKDMDKHFWHGVAILLNVDSPYRRQKLGTTLMRLLHKQMVDKMRSCQKDGHYYIFLYVPDFNTPAQQFFGKIGYVVHSKQPTSSFTIDGIAIEMIKEIAEERLSNREIQQIGLCRFCVEAKSKANEALLKPNVLEALLKALGLNSISKCSEDQSNNASKHTSRHHVNAGHANQILKQLQHHLAALDFSTG